MSSELDCGSMLVCTGRSRCQDFVPTVVLGSLVIVSSRMTAFRRYSALGLVHNAAYQSTPCYSWNLSGRAQRITL
jgi:hypothetical protein